MTDPQSTHEERPWGSWHVLDEGEGYKVKRLDGARRTSGCRTRRTPTAPSSGSSSQGVATCLVDGRDRGRQRRASASTSAVGVAHRIANEHDEDLVIVEVQRGSYTGEDDIVRLEDDYGRVPERR